MKRKDSGPLSPPGVMIYRSSRELFRQLEPDMLKALLLAMLDYDGTGDGPETEDPMLALAWAVMRERLDRDRENYEDICMNNRYNRFLREALRYYPRESCPNYEDWYELSEHGSLTAAKTLTRLKER